MHRPFFSSQYYNIVSIYFQILFLSVLLCANFCFSHTSHIQVQLMPNQRLVNNLVLGKIAILPLAAALLLGDILLLLQGSQDVSTIALKRS